MSDYKNIKVEINKEQPLHLVVKELDRLGCWFNMDDGDNSLAKWVIVVGLDRYDIYNNDRCVKGDWCQLTTLAELKKMKND